MATSGKLKDDAIIGRIIELLAHGSSRQTIAKALIAEKFVDSIQPSAIHYQIKRIVADPILSKQFELERRSALASQASQLHEIAWDTLTKIRNVLNKVDTDENSPLDPVAIAVLERLSPQLEKWWKNLSQIAGLTKEAGTTVNLTQVNVDQVNVMNSQLLGVIQDMMRMLPTEKQRVFMERIRELGETPEVVETTGELKHDDTRTED